MYLDLGQATFASRTVCPTCGMLYVHGLAEDAAAHERVCSEHRVGVPFRGWKGERVVARWEGGKGQGQGQASGEEGGGRIVEVRPDDPARHRALVRRVKAIVDGEMGFADGGGGDGGRGGRCGRRFLLLLLVPVREDGLPVRGRRDRGGSLHRRGPGDGPPAARGGGGGGGGSSPRPRRPEPAPVPPPHPGRHGDPPALVPPHPQEGGSRHQAGRRGPVQAGVRDDGPRGSGGVQQPHRRRAGLRQEVLGDRNASGLRLSLAK